MGTGHRLHAAAASFWREWYRDLRRHSGDERLPYPIRTTLRDAADRAFARCALEETRAIAPRWNRRTIRTAPPVRLSAEDERRARCLAAEVGITASQPTVTVEILNRPDLWSSAIELLRREDYQIVRIGGGAAGVLHGPGVIDLTSHAPRVLLEKYLLASSAFVVCNSVDLQHAAYVTDTPSLLLDARDPFSAYPIRPNGVFTLATVVDLDTGRVLGLSDLLTPQYFRNTRNCGYRPTRGAEMASAVSEMIDGVRHGWGESDAQTRCRRAIAEAGTALAPQVRDVVEWNAAGGFVGDGRLARVQAERAL